MTQRALPDDPMAVDASEFGLVRVFAMDRDEMVTATGIDNFIGVPLVSGKVEVLDTRDIKAIGLVGYLVAGYGLSAEDLRDDAEALNAIDGHVALIPTSAFGGQAAVLSPRPPLRFVGLFAEAEGTAPLPPAPAPAREPSAPEPVETEETPQNSHERTGNRFPAVLIAFALAVALVLWVVV